MTELITRLAYEEDVQSRKKLQVGLDNITSQQKELSKSLSKGGIASKDYAKSIASLSKEAVVLKKAIAPLDRDIKNYEKALDAAAKAEAKFNQELEETVDDVDTLDKRLAGLDANLGQISQQVGIAGDIEGAARTIGGGIGTAGGAVGQQAEQAIALLSEGFAALEAAPRLKTALAGLPDVAEKAAESLGASGMTRSVQQLIPQLSSGQAAMLALGGATIAITAAIAAVSFGLQKWREHLDSVGEAQQARIDAILHETRIQEEIADLVGEGDYEGIVSGHEAAFDAATRGAREIARIEEEIARLEAAAAETDEGVSGLVQNIPSVFGLIARQVIGAEEREELERTRETYQDLINQQAINQETLTEYETALANVDEAELQRIEYAEDLAQIERDLSSIESERTQLLQQQEQAQNRVAQLEAQIASAIEDRALRASEAEALQTLEAQFAHEDELAEEQAFRDELSEIADASRERLKTINAEIAALPLERDKALLQVASQGQDKIAKINGDFMDKQLKSTREFGKQTQRLEEDNKRARLKLIEDITQRLDDAARDNNVIAFLEAQRDGQKQLKEQAENDNTAAQRRVEDFSAKVKEAEEARQEQVDNTLKAIAEERQKVIDSFNERRAALKEAHDAEIVAAKEAQDAAIARYNEEQAREEQQAARQAARDALRDEQEQARFDARIAQIEEQKQAELDAAHEIQVAIDALVRSASDLQARAASATQPSRQPPTESSSPFSPVSLQSRFRAGLSREVALGLRRAPVAFAEGGIADEPTFGMFGEKPGMSEALIPFRKSEGLPAALARTGAGGKPSNVINTTVNLYNTIGDIATQTMLNNEIESAVQTVLNDGIAVVLEKALTGGTP